MSISIAAKAARQFLTKGVRTAALQCVPKRHSDHDEYHDHTPNKAAKLLTVQPNQPSPVSFKTICQTMSSNPCARISVRTEKAEKIVQAWRNISVGYYCGCGCGCGLSENIRAIFFEENGSKKYTFVCERDIEMIVALANKGVFPFRHIVNMGKFGPVFV